MHLEIVSTITQEGKRKCIDWKERENSPSMITAEHLVGTNKNITNDPLTLSGCLR
jgi:hypothetical protein